MLSRSRIILAALALLITSYTFVAMVTVQHQPPPLVDEPIFASSALEFARSGEINISNLSAPNAVFDTVWGGLFVLVLGESYQALRISTILLTAISGPFVYLLCRTLGGSRRASVLGVAAYFFAPLAFQLSTTFQTDSHFLALTVMAISAIAYGLAWETRRVRFLLAGSGLVALAFLSRPQALIVTIAAVLVWLFHTKDRPSRLRGIIALSALPAMAVATHSIWTWIAGEPYIRELYTARLLELNPKTYLAIGAQGAIDSGFYVGMFALSFLPLLLPGVRQDPRRSRRLVVYPAAAIGAVAVGLLFTKEGFIFEGSWVHTTGFGAVHRSFLGSPPSLPFWAVAFLIAACAVSTYLLILSQAPKKLSRAAQSSYLFVAVVLVGFVVGAAISTLGAHGRILDRYWLPILPLVIALATSVAQITRARLLIAWSLVGALALVSVVGTMDAFNTYRAASGFADDIVSKGVDPLALDGGASWSAATFGLSDDDPAHLDRPGPFWIKFYAVDSAPEYGISLSPLEGYEVLERREYRSILHPGPNYLYLVHRDPGLPFYIRQSDL